MKFIVSIFMMICGPLALAGETSALNPQLAYGGFSNCTGLSGPIHLHFVRCQGRNVLGIPAWECDYFADSVQGSCHYFKARDLANTLYALGVPPSFSGNDMNGLIRFEVRDVECSMASCKMLSGL